MVGVGLNVQVWELEQDGLQPVAVWLNPRTLRRIKHGLERMLLTEVYYWNDLSVFVDRNVPDEGYVQANGMRKVWRDWWAEAGVQANWE